jgi:hypothetical protein
VIESAGRGNAGWKGRFSRPAEPRRIGQYVPGGARADAPPDAAVFGKRHIAVLNGTRRTSTHSAVPGDARTDRTEFLDVTDPRNPRLQHTFGPDQVDGESHNGDIVDERRIYLPSGGVGAQGLRIYDLRPLLAKQPAAPRDVFRGDPAELWARSPYRGDKPVGAPFTHTHDITVYPDHDGAGLGQRDIALLAEGGNYTGEGDTGSVFVVDITNPAEPVLSEWFIPLGTPAPVCSVHVFSSDDGLVFFGSYNAGLQVVDYSDPANPRRAGQYIAEGTTAWGAQEHEGYVYVGDMSRGLDVLRWSPGG